MKKTSEILRPLIALFLAVAVINIYVTDFYCSFSKEAAHHPSSALTEQKENHHSHEVDASEEHHHHGDDAEEHHHHDANQPEGEGPHDGNNDGNCCKDNSSAFFSSLTHQPVHSVFIKAPVNPLFFQVNSINQFLAYDTFSSSPEYLLFRPP
ncbi:MAG TPA: hypothetical protein VJY62_14230, partial [Bacteroidia bacterium]|nr:hypothetical protein [Bacteroidia bacterium]